MKDVKYRLNYFLPYDRSGMEQYLEKQAAKGWQLENLSRNAVYWTFRRTEPQAVHYAITYPPDFKASSPDFCNDRRAFRDLCEKDGWETVTYSLSLEIFVNSAEEPTPIDTDATVELSSIHRVMKRSLVIPCICALLLLVLYSLPLLRSMLEYPFHALIDGDAWLPLISVFIGLASFTYALLRYYHWHHKAKTSVKKGNMFTAPRGNVFTFWIMIIVALLVLFAKQHSVIALICGFGLILSFWIFVKLYHRFGYNKWYSYVLLAIAFLVFQFLLPSLFFNFKDRPPYYGDVPLTIDELVESDTCEPYSHIWNDKRSPVLTIQEINSGYEIESGQDTSVSYYILNVKFPLLYDWCIDQLKYHQNITPFTYVDTESVYEQVDIVVPGLNAAYQLQNSTDCFYLLCYDTRIVRLKFSWDDVTKEELETACAELRP